MRTPANKTDLGFLAEYWKGMYGTPRAWAGAGERLVHSFRALAEVSDKSQFHTNLHDQAYMLAGMAIEVQLKAIIVADPISRRVVLKKSHTTPEEKFLQNAFSSHNLVKIAVAANVTLTHGEVEIAEVLSEYIYWRGRYVLPTEKGISDLASVPRKNGLVGQPHLDITVSDVEALIQTVVTNVKSRLY